MGAPEARPDPGREESQEPQESPKERLDRELIEQWANGLIIAGMGCIVLGITLSVALVLDVALGSPLSLLLSLLTGAWFAWFWFGVPVLRRRRFAQPSGPPG